MRTRPSRTPYAVCVADFNADGQQDLLLGDHYYLRRSAGDQDSQSEADAKIRRAFGGKYYELIKQSNEGTRADRVAAFRGALRDWDELSTLTFSGPQAASPR